MLFTEAPQPCYEEPDLWFSEKKSDEAAAKQLCRSCPVVAQCLEDALNTESMLGTTLRGVHGGLTQQERLQRKEAS